MDKRARALLEVSLATLATVLVLWFFEAYLKWLAFWDWYAKALIALIALIAVVLPRRSPRAYGFLPRNPRFTLKWSALVVAAFVLPATVAIALSMVLGVAKPVKTTPLSVLLYVVWIVVFIGLVEEAYFRGYVQSRLEEAFGKRWKRLVFKPWRVDYGIGMLVSSTIFGLVHVVNYSNPLIPRWEPAWWMPLHILGCFAFGCLAGALREASGDIYVPASLHGGVMAAYAFLSAFTNAITLNVALFTGWFIFFYSITPFFSKAERAGTAEGGNRLRPNPGERGSQL